MESWEKEGQLELEAHKEEKNQKHTERVTWAETGIVRRTRRRNGCKFRLETRFSTLSDSMSPLRS